MPWICPACNRVFRNVNQWHSCVRVKAEDHLKNKSPAVAEIFNTLLNKVKKFGEVKISTVKSGILLKNCSTFLSIKPKKKWLDMEFLLCREVNDFPVYKTFRLSKNRVAHFVRLENKMEIDSQLLKWLKESFDIAGE